MRRGTKRVAFAAAGVIAATLAAGCIPPPETPATTTTTTAAPAPLLVDQKNDPAEFNYSDGAILGSCGDSWDTDHQNMQTFTAGVTGTLEQVSLPLYTYVADPPPLIVEIRPMLAPGEPDMNTLLGTGSYDGPGLGEYVFQTFPSPTELLDIALVAPAPVVAGTQYALITGVDHDLCGVDNAAWSGPVRVASTDQYAGGAGYYLPKDLGTWVPRSLDLIFATWVRATS